MNFTQIEYICNRAAQHCFARKKLLLTFPVIALCGLFIVFCRALAISASSWMVMSLTFLPFFLCSSVLLSLGVLLVRIYHNEVKQIHTSYRKLFAQSWELLIGISYMSLPMLLTYLFLWMFLGIFYLLREIPGIGEFFGVVLAFGPFLLVLGTMMLSMLNVFSLYFLTPHVALTYGSKRKLFANIVERLSKNAFSHVACFLFALTPLMVVVGLLYSAAAITGATFAVQDQSLAMVLQWFFIMIPFCAIVTPGVIFFFNFSMESYVLLEKRRHAIEAK